MSKPDQDKLHAMRHSLAHIMATAIRHLWPEAKFGVGPVVENGFYYDVDLGATKLSEEDFGKLEAEMRKVIGQNLPFERTLVAIDAAIVWAKENNQPYKEDLLNDLKRAGTTVAKDLDEDELGTITGGDAKVDEVSFYTNGDFTDLCRGPHIESTGKVGKFKLMRISGAYWRGKETNPQMQRIYGVAFASDADLKKHLTMLEEIKKRDHRKLGQELDLFTFSDLIGAGLPLWTPRGTCIKRELDNFVQELRDKYEYQEVSIPHITKKEAFIASGHWQKFNDELFKIKTREGHEFAMKPMNCPHHTQIYARRPHSYKELPIRYRETTTVYRDEQTGELSGLSRVRAINQDDAHVFCRHSQIEDEVEKIWDVVDKFYKVFDFPLDVRFSRHDPQQMKSYMGDPVRWQESEEQLKSIVERKVGKNYIDGLGDAAFYGPKIDFVSHDSLGRELQVATIQLDFNQPQGFDLVCISEQGERERIVMIHAAIMGSIERFLSVLIEHTAGKFPVWLSPEQVRVATVNQEKATLKFAVQLKKKATELGVRLSVDDSNESIGKKIREAELWKVPYTIVVGDKEIKGGPLLPRLRGDIVGKTINPKVKADKFLQVVADESKKRLSKSSL